MQPSKSLDISNTMEKKNNYIKLTLVDLNFDSSICLCAIINYIM